MRRSARVVAAVFVLVASPRPLAAQPASPDVPGRFDWQHKTPAEVGMDPARLDEAVKLAIASENPATKDLSIFLATVVGLARQRGRIRDVNDYARDYMPPGVDLFEAPHKKMLGAINK